MIHPDILATPARERSGTVPAEAARRDRQARRYRHPDRASGTRTTPLRRLLPWLPGRSPRPGGPPRPAAEGTPVVLRDGSAVLIRQVRSTDVPLLADGFARLGPQSRQIRFLGAKTALSAAELRYLTDVDHHDHEAISALSATDGRGVGIARYIRDADDPQAAEIAVTVVDDCQGRGLGTELLSRLSGRARHAGIHRFTALVADDNVAMAALLQNMNASLAGRSPGTVDYEITLTPPATTTTTAAAGFCQDRVPTPC